MYLSFYDSLGAKWVMMAVRFGWYIELERVSIYSLISQRLLVLFIVGSLPYCPLRQLWRGEQHGSLCPLCECVLIALRPCRLVPELGAFFLHGFLSLVCPDSNALWINVVYWNWCLMRPSVLKNELDKFDAAALGCRLAEQLRWWRCSFIRTS